MINVHRAIEGRFGHLCNGAALDLDWRRPSYLAKLLNAADWGLMHNGTLLVFSCSAMNLCISSEINWKKKIVNFRKMIENSRFTFNLLHRGHFSLPMVVEGLWSSAFELRGILSHTTCSRVTTFTHARVISQSTFVQVGMCQCINHRYSFILKISNLVKIENRGTAVNHSTLAYDTLQLQSFTNKTT